MPQHTLVRMDLEVELLRDIRYALRFKSLAWRLAELDATIEAERILAHLKLCGWEFSHQPPAPLHRTPGGAF